MPLLRHINEDFSLTSVEAYEALALFPSCIVSADEKECLGKEVVAYLFAIPRSR